MNARIATLGPARPPASWEYRLLYGLLYPLFFTSACCRLAVPGRTAVNDAVPSRSPFRRARAATETVLPFAFMG